MPAPVQIPLFPLKTVLFPTQALPLNIFEERYKQMMAACLEGDSSFGVVLIKSGEEVGEPAEPHNVGTVALITDVVRYPDGRLDLNTYGMRRFAVRDVVTTRPYLVGQVEWVEDTDEGAPECAATGLEVGHAFQDYFKVLLQLSNQWVRALKLPARPEDLSYLVAARLDVPPLEKQRLLALTSTLERLQAERALLQTEQVRVQRLLQEKTPFRGFSSN